MSSRFIHVVLYARISFLFKANYYFTVWKCHISLSNHVNRHLGCFYLLVIVNGTAMNMGVQVSFLDPAFNYLACMARGEIAGLYSRSSFDFVGEVSHSFP